MPELSLQSAARSEGDVVWISIGDPEGKGRQRHIGLEIAEAPGKIRFLHLAWHFLLKYEDPFPAFKWAAVGLEPVLQKVVAAKALTIAAAKPMVPYAFDAEGIVFAEDGSLLPPPLGKGLTCATFVLALFKHVGLDVLDEEAWPSRDEDDEWQTRIISALEGKNAASAEHVAELKANRAKRFRPEEVAGAATEDHGTWPVGFPDARTLAQSILSDLYA